ncbi:MAG TPA: hypothetical protein ENI23_08400 [bacterium]|nr:hypothetical protein [bacterium]
MTDNLISREIIQKLDDRSTEEHLRDHYRDIWRLYQGIFVDMENGVFLFNLKSGATQVAADATLNELWFTSGHATLPDNVVLIGA